MRMRIWLCMKERMGVYIGMNEWMNERMNEWMNEWMNERMNECMRIAYDSLKWKLFNW